MTDDLTGHDQGYADVVAAEGVGAEEIVAPDEAPVCAFDLLRCR